MLTHAYIDSLYKKLVRFSQAPTENLTSYMVEQLVCMEISNGLLITPDEICTRWIALSVLHRVEPIVEYIADKCELLAGPTKRWNKLRSHPIQRELLTCESRFVTVPAGRRSGKTEAAKRKVVQSAVDACLNPQWDDARFICAAPTQLQAKRIYWADLKRMVPAKLLDGKPSESELTIKLKGDVEILVMGMDVPERAEGSPLNGLVLDEYGNMLPHVWTEHLRPMVADRKGWVWFIGVPEGRNHYYELDRDAKANTSGMWKSYHWKSSEIVDPEELEAAKKDMDPLTYQQEFDADFVTFSGRAYYGFDAGIHAVKSLKYDEYRDLILCFDFNVEPGVCVICQEHDETWIIDEVYIPQNSTTPAVCRKIAATYGKHPRGVYCYGDATGGSRGSAKVAGSDWDLIKKELQPVFGDNIRFRVKSHNPAERARVNAVNSRLMTADKRVHMLVDPVKAKHVVEDLDGVRLLEGGSGELDKKHDEKLTHLSDALGYYIEYKFPVNGGTRVVSQEI